MFTFPASNVSEPLTIVIRICVNTPLRDLAEAPQAMPAAFHPEIALHAHVLVEASTNSIVPPPAYNRASDQSALHAKPVVKATAFWAAEAGCNLPPDPIYPLVSNPPESPNWVIIGDEPEVLNEDILIVTRLVPAGIPVKSIVAPDVEATAVPNVIPAGSTPLAISPD